MKHKKQTVMSSMKGSRGDFLIEAACSSLSCSHGNSLQFVNVSGGNFRLMLCRLMPFDHREPFKLIEFMFY